MKILIGVDGSLYSRAAVEFVCRLPLPKGTRVIVASAMPAPVLAYTELHVPASVAIDELMEEQAKARQELVSRAERELRDAGLVTESRVVPGDPREAIVQAARDEGVDLIVVGSHGRTGFAKLLMGSVATHVVTHAPCSVLVVKSDRNEA